MPLELKPIGGDDFEEILAEAKARIPVHTPEWTHFNESDPGITLVELFAFMTESLLYRANRIPERNRQKFLQLLRLPLQPATPARGFAVFDGAKGPLEPTVVDTDATRLLAGKVEFRVTSDVTVLPVEWRILYKAPVTPSDDELEDYQAAYASFIDRDVSQLRFYETRELPVPEKGKELPEFDVGDETLDDCVWIVLLAPETATVEDVRAQIGGMTLSVGIVPVQDDEVVAHPFAPSGADVASSLIWETSTDEVDESGAAPLPRYRKLDASMDVDVLQEPGVVQITLPGPDELLVWTYTEPIEEGSGDFPPRLEEEDVGARVVAWIRMRFRGAPTVALHWMGLNAAQVRQGVLVTNELLGKGTGEPDQALNVAHVPVLAGSLELLVEDGEDGWETWSEVTDFLGEPRSAAVYTLDPESGAIRFGDGIEGRRPGEGRRIRASYEYGGGVAGNVPTAALSKVGGADFPAGIKVANPLPTYGGAEAETTEEGERRIPQHLRHRERAVTRDDFEDIVERTPGVRLGRLEVLAAYHPEVGAPSPGVVTLMVIPEEDAVTPAAPRPDSFFLRQICDWVEPRRLVTTEVHILGPCYVPVWVSAGVKVRTGYGRDAVRQEVRETLRAYLSPIVGGPDGDGWPLGKGLLAKDLEAQATRVAGVEYVEGMLLAGSDGSAVESIELEGLELPELVDIEVTEGEPDPIEEVKGDSPRSGVEVLDDVVAVPVVPEAC